MARDPTLEIVGEVPWSLDIAAAAQSAAQSLDAEVVVAGSAASDAPTIEKLLEVRPRARVLTIADDGAQGVLYRLAPEATTLGELSPERLLEAMRG